MAPSRSKTDPEILRIDIAGLLLHLKCLGLDDLITFLCNYLVTPPTRAQLERALEMLHRMGAIDRNSILLDLDVDSTRASIA